MREKENIDRKRVYPKTEKTQKKIDKYGQMHKRMGLSQKSGGFSLMATAIITPLKVNRFNEVRFGTLTRDGRQYVLVPCFTAGQCTNGHVIELNRASRLRQKNMTETLLEEAIGRTMDGKSPPRVLQEGNTFIPIDQEAASKMVQLGFKRLEKAHTIPI